MVQNCKVVSLLENFHNTGRQKVHPGKKRVQSACFEKSVQFGLRKSLLTKMVTELNEEL